jgi:hypothetical protein
MAKDQSEFRELLHRYQRGECTPAEKQRLEAWYRQLGQEQSFNLSPAEKENLVATVWQRIASRTAVGKRPDTRARLPEAWASWPASVRWAAAAAVVLSIGLLSAQLGYGPLRMERLALHPAPVAGAQTASGQWQVYTNSSP